MKNPFMNNMLFLSIIIPVYKVEPYLRECLDSIAASPLDCWEAILIDDGSPDACPQICDEHAAKDKRFRVIHQQNAGVAAARNAGLDVAQGEWCWFVDSDDVVDMRPVGEMVRWLKDHQDVDLVMSDLMTFKDGDTIPLSFLPFTIADEHLSKDDFLIKHICYHHPRLWYRKTQLRFTCGIKTGEDGEFMYKYLMRCKHPMRVLSTIYYYRIRQGSATNSESSRAQVVKDTIQVLYNFLAFMKEHHIVLEPWFTLRLQGTMKILLYSIYKSKQHHKMELQQSIRNIYKQYKDAGYDAFDSLLLIIAKYNIPLYCFLLKVNLYLKGIQ